MLAAKLTKGESSADKRRYQSTREPEEAERRLQMSEERVRKLNDDRIVELENTVAKLRSELAYTKDEMEKRDLNNKRLLQSKDEELNALAKDVRSTKLNDWEINYSNGVIDDILTNSRKYQDYSQVDPKTLSLKEKANSLKKLFTFMIDDKGRLEDKLNNIQRSYDSMAEMNRLNERKFSPQKFGELQDTNFTMKQELNKIRLDYE